MGLQLERALAIVWQTMPYVLYRLMVYGLLCLCVIAYLVFLAIIGFVFGAGAFWVLVVLSAILAGMAGIGSFVGEYIFCRQRAGHIALITEIIAEGQLPVGISQMKWARGRVLHYFNGMAVLPEVRRLVRETVRGINGTLLDTAAVLPAPAIEGGPKLARQMVRFSQGYVEEAVIAHAFKTKDENVFESARAAILLYCQCWKDVLGNAVTLTLLGYGFTLLASVLFLVPLGIVALAFFQEWTVARFTLFAIGVFLGFAAKWALFDPVAGAATVLTFIEESNLLTPDPEWESRIESVAPAFVELKARAAERSAKAPPRAAR